MKIFKTRNVKTPERRGYNAGIDFFIPTDFKEKFINPGDQILIPCGIKVEIPRNNCLIAFNKSGIFTKYNLQVGACVIDENYTGEIHINLFNLGENKVLLKPNQKIIQFVLIKQKYINIEVCENLGEMYNKKIKKQRGSKGFGSTGE